VQHIVRRVRVVIAVAFACIAATSCGSEPADSAPPKVVEIVVPTGTQAKLNRGETVQVMPARLEFRVGDVLRVRNDDVVDQYVGPYLVVAGQQFELRFGAPGRYAGLCNLSGGSSYEIVIT
jgi:hypothetical protein